MDWVVEFEQRQKPLDELQAPELRALIEPIRSHLQNALVALLDDPKISTFRVVFFFDSEANLKFRFEGPVHLVNAAIDEIGTDAVVPPPSQH